MKQLNVLMLLILSVILPAPGITSAESSLFNQNSAIEFEPDSAGNYSAEEVAALVRIMTEEADRAVERAYAEGYKAALLETAPETARLRVMNDALTLRLYEEQKKSRSIWWIAPAAFLAGGAAGLLTGTLTAR